MAFHLACPLTCRKICYCTYGSPKQSQFPDGTQASLQELIRSVGGDFGGEKFLDILVPCLPKDVKKNKQKLAGGQVGTEIGEGGQATTPSKKRAVSHRKIAVSWIGRAEATPIAEQAKKAANVAKVGGIRHTADTRDTITKGFRSGAPRARAEELHGVNVPVRHGSESAPIVEDAALSHLPGVVCGLCSLEISGREKAKRVLSCHGCKKKFHSKCVKRWAEFRDLFNWASWVCASCRSCEVCRRPGEVDKLMFCKRCDAALHTYCQQPPLKHVPKGPYLCPKHTCCHSCGSNVPGSGVSSRWFMSFTTCDACGRLFVKEKYCPVCLKVYRDSEATPMVCCDSCKHWVHCRCDGISDEKFNQFEHDDNLQYKCAACRGDCHKVNGMDDAVRELWKRRDKADADQRAKLAAAARLPSKEEMLKLCPSSDDEKRPPSPRFQASGHSKKLLDARMQIGKKRKKHVVLYPSANTQPGEIVRKKVVTQRHELKVVPGNSSAEEE